MALFPSSFGYTDIHMTQGAAANDLNAGSMFTGNGQVYTNDGPHRANANCNVVDIGGARWNIENMAITGWGDTAVDDYVRIDTGGAKELGRVTALAVGADSDVIEIAERGVGGITAPNNGVNCNVGGAFATLNAMTDLFTAISNMDGHGPLALNVKRHGGTPYVQACDIDTNAGTSLRPITIRGYNTTPGDIDPLVDTDRAVFEPDAGAIGALSAVIKLQKQWIRLLNLHLETAVAGKYGIDQRNTGGYATFLNCHMEGPTFGMAGNGARNVMKRCHVEGAANGAFLNWAGGRIISNRFHGGTGYALAVEGDSLVAIGNLCYGAGTIGLDLVTNNLRGATIKHNTIADNGGAGIDFGTEAELEGNIITNNIIAHNGGWGIGGGGAEARFLIDYNMIYGNTAGAVEDIEAGGILVDNSLHDDETNAPFTGANAGARAANFYELTSAAKQVQQVFADDDFKTYPDAGAQQSILGGYRRGFGAGFH